MSPINQNVILKAYFTKKDKETVSLKGRGIEQINS